MPQILDLNSLYTHEPYYFMDSSNQRFALFEIKLSGQHYVLHSKQGLSFITHPNEYINAETHDVVYADTKALHGAIETIIAAFHQAGYELCCQNAWEFIEDIYCLPSDEVQSVDVEDILQSYRLEEHGLRYDVYPNQIKVNREQVDNAKLSNEELFSLYYEEQAELEEAITLSLQQYADKNIKRYASLAELLIEMRRFEQVENKEFNRELLIFEHLLTVESYIGKELSGLQHALPLTDFQGIDLDDIEQGRLYFWVKKHERDFLQSPMRFFVLQNRAKGTFVLSGIAKVYQFNREYAEAYIESSGWRSRLEEMLNDIVADNATFENVAEEIWQEVSQERIIAALTQQPQAAILTSKPLHSVYLYADIYDVYEHMIQHWRVDGTNRVYHNYFFHSATEQEQWLKRALIVQQGQKLEFGEKAAMQDYIDDFAELMMTNQRYLEQKVVKESLLAQIPAVDSMLSGYDRSKLMQYSPLKIIEGDYQVDGDLMLQAESGSLIIKGDLLVDGTLYFHCQELFSQNFILVMGNVVAKNYLHNGGAYCVCLLANDVDIEQVCYLPAASSTWCITIGGQLTTQTLLHNKLAAITDDKLIFDAEYCIEDRDIFQSWFLNKKGQQYKNQFDGLVQGKDIFVDAKVNEKTHQDQRLLLAFKNKLKNWPSLYYVFAGLVDLELEEGTHYGCYIESDLILNDVRQDSGYYLMSHDDFSLSLVKDNKPMIEGRLSTQHLAYRFFWVMWTFSGWQHRHDSPMDYWQSVDAINTRYQSGKVHFQNDPYLALYWIMHFGLLDDARIEEMQQIMRDSQHPLIRGAFLFFAELKTIGCFSIEIDGHENSSSTLFSERIERHKNALKKAHAATAGA